MFRNNFSKNQKNFTFDMQEYEAMQEYEKSQILPNSKRLKLASTFDEIILKVR